MTSTSKTDNLPRKIGITAAWLVIWQAAAFLVHNPILLAGPVETARALAEMAVTALFWRSIGFTLVRIGLGTVLGTAAGCGLAATAYRSAGIRQFFEPFVSVVRAVPVASFVVLVIIGAGSEWLAMIISGLVVFPILYEAVLSGLMATDRAMIEMADVFGLAPIRRWRLIYRPQLKPFLTSSMQTAVGMAWKSGVAAEVIGQPLRSVGNGLYRAKIYLETDKVLAWTAAVIACSWLCSKAVTALIKRVGAPSRSRRVAGHSADAAAKADTSPAKADQSPSASGSAVELTDIGKSYGEKTVLRNISVSVPPGGRLVITGPSGCGKTTLIRLILGLEKPDKGLIRVGGKDVADVQRAGAAFQETRLSETASVYENVAAAGTEDGILEELIPGIDSSMAAGELSGGMKRRAAVARALASTAPLLVLDEPFAGLDDISRERTLSCILRRQAGRTLIITAHDRTELLSVLQQEPAQALSAATQEPAQHALFDVLDLVSADNSGETCAEVPD